MQIDTTPDIEAAHLLILRQTFAAAGSGVTGKEADCSGCAMT